MTSLRAIWRKYQFAALLAPMMVGLSIDAGEFRINIIELQGGRVIVRFSSEPDAYYLLYGS